MSQQDHKDFFISYTSADSRWAEWIAWQLEEAGYSVILQAWDFRPGANFVSEMERAISNVKRTIAVLSPQYLNALYTQPEWAAAFRRDPKGEQGILVPVRIQECEVTGLLGQIIYVDLVGRDEVSASKILLAGVRHERAKPEMAPAFPERVLHTVSKQLSFPGDLPSTWNVPYPRDPLFVGRERVLNDLHSTLHTKHQAALTPPSAGSDPSNIGVTETAIEYVYRYQSDYRIILWAHASSRQTLLSDCMGIASLLNLPENIAQRQDDMVNAVKRWLQTQTHWLLVLEDVQDPEVIQEFIPSLNRGSLLLTTRIPFVSQLFPRVEMDRMKPEEQTLLLQLSRIVGATLRSSQRRMPLGIERVTIGRTQDNQIVLNDPAVSSHHAEILLKEQGYWITDVGSTNGTFVNQQSLERHVPYLLHPRDAIRISNTTFTYEVNDTASSKLAAVPISTAIPTPSNQNVLPTPSNEAHMGEHVGKQLGNYRLVRLIGQGGFAEVYLGEHIYLDTQAAIKVLYTKLAKDDIEAFRLEARTIARLVHPHIVRVLDFGVEGTTPFLVMDYAPGDTLRQLHPKGTRLPLETVVSYVKQIALALQYAHEQKVIHRDVKPENMLMGRNGEVLLSDFGIALITQSSRYESSIDMAGTIAYMAPEQIEAHPRPASDQYSLGIVVYEWLTGDRPFHGSFREIAIKHSVVPPPSLCEQVATLPLAVEQVVLTALAKDPQQRFKSMQAFSNALGEASRSTPTFFSPPASVLPLPPAPESPQLFSPPALRGPSPEPSSILPSMNAPSYQSSPPRDQILQQKQPSIHTDPVGEQRQSSLSVPPTIAIPPHQSVSPPASPLPAKPPSINHHRGLSRIKVGMLIGLAIIVIIVSVGLFSHFSTTGTSTTGTSTGTTTTNAVKGGTWIDDLFQEPDSLIPNAGSQTFDVVVEQALYAPLFVGNYKGQITLGAAFEIPTVAYGDISSDLKTWTFKMKPGLKWSDGQPYTADDVNYTWQLWDNPKFGAASTVGYNLITSADVSSDKLSITFHLKQPYVGFLAVWTDGGGAPLPAHHFSSMAPDAILKSSDSLNPSVTSGPFKMSESVHGDHYTVVRNTNYYRASEGLPYLDKIIFRPIASEDTILKDLQAGSITSSWFLDVSKTPVYKNLTNYSLTVNPNASNYEVMIINLKNPILGKNLEVRQAMAMAIDKNTLIATARLGSASPLCTDHGRSFNPGFQADAACPQFNPSAANALLDQHGWVRGSDGIRSKNGQRLSFTYSTTTGKPWRAADEAIIQSNFKDIGIQINIQNYPASTFFGTFMPGGKGDLGEFENAYVYDPDDSTLLACSQQGTNGQNWSFYCKQQMEGFLKAEQSSGDPAARQAAFNQIHNLELTDIPFVILYSPLDLGIAKKTTNNYAPGPIGASETVNVWEWWCTGGTC